MSYRLLKKEIFLLSIVVWLCSVQAAYPQAKQQQGAEAVDRRVPFGDPFILLWEGKYYAYGTHSANGIEVLVSDDLVTWEVPPGVQEGLALNKMNTGASRWFWAPEVYCVKGKFYMYYSADEHICVATSDSPLGPFKQEIRKPMIEGEKCIDNSLFVDDNGKKYLFFDRFNDGLNIWISELEDDLLHIKPETMHPCIHVSQPWEEVWPRVNEGVFVMKHKGVYYMTYSANSYESPFYGIGVATANSPAGPWTKYADNPALQKPGELVGVGHSALFTDKEGKLRIVFHAHNSTAQIHPRHMYIGYAGFEKVAGKTVLKIDKKFITPVLNRKSDPEKETKSTFTNPVWNGADPWMVKKGNEYIYCYAASNSIVVSKSTKMTRRGETKTIWKAPSTGWNKSCIWAPEIHFIGNRWYVYYAAGESGPPFIHQRTGVLQSKTEDVFSGYEDMGMLYTGDHPEDPASNIWAIDMTILDHGGKLYAIWSGWTNQEKSDATRQHLYISEMESPTRLKGRRVLLSSPIESWETGGPLNLNEGPEILKHGDKVFVVYSCRESWTVNYRLGMLQLIHPEGNLLDPANWKKTGPVFQGTPEVFGVGHCSFVQSPDNSEDWIVYHSKKETTPGWKRDVRMQPFIWNTDGTPNFGQPIPAGQKLKLPSGEVE